MSLQSMLIFTLLHVQAVFFLIYFMCLSVSLFILIYPSFSLVEAVAAYKQNAMKGWANILVGTRDFAAYTKPQPPVVVRLVRAKQDIFYILVVHHKSLHEVILLFHDCCELKSLY